MPDTHDLALLAAQLQRMAPGIGPLGTLEHVDDGYGATILRSTTGVAIRVPKSAQAGERQQALISPLRRLARLLPVPIPTPRWSLPMAYPFPFGIAGYSWLSGEPPETATPHPAIAEQLGNLLATMHALDDDTLATFQRWFPDRAAIDAERERVMSVALLFLRDLFPPRIVARLEHWWGDYRTERAAARYAPRLVHGDLWYGNLLVDRGGQRLTGVVDWENVCIDDPAQDFATLMHSGGAFTELVMRAYEQAGGVIDDATLGRCQWHWEYREFSGIALALDAGDEAEALDAARKLREGALAELFAGSEGKAS